MNKHRNVKHKFKNHIRNAATFAHVELSMQQQL